MRHSMNFKSFNHFESTLFEKRVEKGQEIVKALYQRDPAVLKLIENDEYELINYANPIKEELAYLKPESKKQYIFELASDLRFYDVIVYLLNSKKSFYQENNYYRLNTALWSAAKKGDIWLC